MTDDRTRPIRTPSRIAGAPGMSVAHAMARFLMRSARSGSVSDTDLAWLPSSYPMSFSEGMSASLAGNDNARLMRGIAFGLLFSVPMWAAIWAIVRWVLS